MREVALLIMVGAAIGVPMAVAATRLVASALFDVNPTDPATFAMATVIMFAVAAGAGYLPARRASHVDPMVALRYG